MESRESAEEMKARMTETSESELRARKEQRLWERANTMRRYRKQIRETRFLPSPPVGIRNLYEAYETAIARGHPLGSPGQPSWRMDDDAEYEQFLKRYYVDALLAPLKRRLSSRQTFLAKFVIPAMFILAAAVFLFIVIMSDQPLTLMSVLIPLIITAVIISPCSVYIPLKAVSLDEPYLRVSNFSKEIMVHLTDVKEVEYVQRFKLKFVVLTLKRRTEFGRQIKFVPPATWKSAWKEPEVVGELKKLIRMAELDQDRDRALRKQSN